MRIGAVASFVLLLGVAAGAGSLPQKGFHADFGLTKNILSNSGFELGYWNWKLYPVSGGIPAPGENSLAPEIVREPNGNAAMKMYPTSQVCSFLFPLEKDKKYCVSLDAKNAGKTASELTVLALSANWQMRLGKFKLTDSWTRYSFSFVYDKAMQTEMSTAYLRFCPSAATLVDNVQVEEGGPTPYVAPKVSLGLLVPAGSERNVFPIDDANVAMTIKAVCLPEVKGKIDIQVKAQDMWGKSSIEETLQAEAAPNIEIPLKVNKGRRGVFHVTLKAFDAAGKLLGAGSSRFAICQKLDHGELFSNPHAGHCNMEGRTPGNNRIIVPVINDFLPISGFNLLYPFSLYKQVIDPANAELLEELKARITAFEKETGVKTIVTPPEREMGMAAIVNKGQAGPEDLDKLAAKYKVLAEKLNGTVFYWELMNEPDLMRVEDGPNKDDRSKTPFLTAAAYKKLSSTLKAVNPKNKIIGPCASRPEWVENFLGSGGAESIDIFSFHSYSANPSSDNIYARFTQLREILGKHGLKDMPILNSENYYGNRENRFLRTNPSEFQFYWFSDTELRMALNVGNNFIHHAAAGSKWCSFWADRNMFFNGIRKEFYLSDAFGTANAAIEFLGTAGKGKRLDAGALSDCFVFPEARGGPLVTLCAVADNVSGTISKLPDDVKVYDANGNAINESAFPFTSAPLYLRFPEKTSEREVGKIMAGIEFHGIGSPVEVYFSIAAPDAIVAKVINRINKSVGGEVKLSSLPPGWKVDSPVREFKKLKPGQAETVRFKLDQASVCQARDYQLKAELSSGVYAERFPLTLSAIFADQSPDTAMDSLDSAQWIGLGEGNLSKKFDPRSDWSVAGDLSAKLALAWNARGVTLAVEVTDDAHCPPKNAHDMWQYDSLQVYFDLKRDAVLTSKNISDDATWQIGDVDGETVAWLEMAPVGRFIGANNLTRGIDKTVTAKSVRLGAGKTLYQIFFPAEALPRLKLEKGSSFGFSILINDNDGKGRKTGLTLAPKGKEPFNAPHEFKTVILR